MKPITTRAFTIRIGPRKLRVVVRINRHVPYAGADLRWEIKIDAVSAEGEQVQLFMPYTPDPAHESPEGLRVYLAKQVALALETHFGIPTPAPRAHIAGEIEFVEA